MSLTAANIHIGAANVYIGKNGTAVLPVTGNPPTLFAHTSGVPSGAQTGYTHMGHTEGDTTFTYKAVKTDITSEQVLGVVDAFVTNEECQLVFTAQERLYQALLFAFDNIGVSSNASKHIFYGGNADALVAINTFAAYLSSRRRDATTMFEWICLYKCYSVDGLQLKYSRTNKSTYQVTMKAINDTTRNQSDMLFQFCRELQ